MAYDLTAGENKDVAAPVASPVQVTMNRAVCHKLQVDYSSNALELEIAKGESDGSPGGTITNIREIDRLRIDGTDLDNLLATSTNDGETLGDALERILLAKANTDNVIAAGTIS